MEFLAERFAQEPECWSQDDYELQQYTVHRTTYWLKSEDIKAAIEFLEDTTQYMKDFTETVPPIFESALRWLETCDHPRKNVRLITKYYA